MRDNKKADGDCGSLHTSQLLVGAGMEMLLGDTELDGKTNEEKPQGSSPAVEFREKIVIFTFVTVKPCGGKL